MKGLKIGTLFLLIIFILVASSCAKQTAYYSTEESKKIIVYTSIFPIYDFTKNIGKDKIELKMMVPPTAEPHGWEPTAKLITELEKADIFIYNGAGMEPWVEKLVGSISNKELVIVEASKGIELLNSDQSAGHEGEGYDPHVWLDPTNAVVQANNIKSALVSLDQNNNDFYETNYQKYVKELLSLDQEISNEINKLKAKELVVTHAAFGYFANRYGLRQIAVKGLTPQEEPSAAKLAEIAKLLNEKNLKYIYLETLTEHRLSEVLARETGAKTAVLNPIGGLTMEEINQGKDYISIMRENLETLKQTLGE